MHSLGFGFYSNNVYIMHHCELSKGEPVVALMCHYSTQYRCRKQFPRLRAAEIISVIAIFTVYNIHITKECLHAISGGILYFNCQASNSP